MNASDTFAPTDADRREGESREPNRTASSGAQSPTLEQMLAVANVQSAWARVRCNHGCAGVDGAGISELEPVFAQQWAQLERALRSGTYAPQPLLRIRIPKPSGGERLLGVPTVMDRVVAQAVAQVFIPSWETRFSHRSFAYRPGRGTKDALTAVERTLNQGLEWVLHLDIENFFDSVPHPVVLSALRNDLADGRLRAIVERILKCGVFENGLVRPTTVGLAQGSPLSPLLANIVLHRLDGFIESKGWDFARYADDCLVLAASETFHSLTLESIAAFLGRIWLRLNEQKTTFRRFTHARFLGFAFERDGKGRVVRSVSPEALAEAEKAMTQIVETGGGGPEQIASEAARALASWLAYFWTPHDEPRFRALLYKITAVWQQRFGGLRVPDCLRWEAVQPAASSGEDFDYCGHFRPKASLWDSVDWNQTLRCLFLRGLRSRWWGVEYDLGLGGRPARFALRLGRPRINFRL